jgi:hypothetical protein
VRIPGCKVPGCVLTRGHALSDSQRPCVRPVAGEPPHRRIGHSDPDSPAARRIAAEWADLEPTPPRPR